MTKAASLPAPPNNLTRLGAAPNASSRDDRIDFLRGIAIALVIVLHATMLTPDPVRLGAFFPLIARFSVGMQLFFVISGYLVIQSWWRAVEARRPLWLFWIKRGAKIYPLYFLFLALNVGLWLSLSESSTDVLPIRNFLNHANFNAGNIVAHLFFIQGFIPAYIHSLLDGSWSIANEVYFYLLIPCAMAPFAKSLKASTGLYIFTVALSMTLMVSWPAIVAWPPLAFLRSGNEGFAYYFFLNHLPFFVVGMALAHVLRNLKVITFCVEFRRPLLAATIVFAIGMINGNVWPLGYHHLYTLVLLSGILASFGWPSNGLGFLRRSVARLGRQSYALFFLHLFLLKAFMAAWSLKGWSTENVWGVLAANLAVGFGGSLLLSELLFDRMDRWCVKAGNAFAARVAR